MNPSSGLPPQPRRPRAFWWITLAAALAMALTASLGRWQLGRADTKRALQAQREARAQMPAIGWDGLRAARPEDWAALHDRPVQLRGRWVPQGTRFLDNRQMNGRVGFYVLTPLQSADGQNAVLVQRGWVARDFQDRSRLPALPLPGGEVTVLGRLVPPPSRLYAFEGQEQGPIRQNIDLPSLGQEAGVSLLGASVLQTAPTGDGDTLARDWPLVGSDVHKHLGYAFQWFGLCALIAILYVWFQFIAPRRRVAKPRD